MALPNALPQFCVAPLLAAWTSPCRNNNINGLTLAPLESITLLFMLHLIKTEGVKFMPF